MTKNKLKFIILTILILSFVLAAVEVSMAANLQDAFGTILDKVGGGAGYQTTGAKEQPAVLVGQVIKVILSFVGVIFLVLMIYGGYLWMTARGNEQQVTKAKDLIVAAIIGLIIVLSAYAVSYFIFREIGKETLEGVL